MSTVHYVYKAVKELFREKEPTIWNCSERTLMGVVKFWAVVGRTTKGQKKSTTLKSDAGVSTTSTRVKLEVLQRHYQHLGNISVDFDANWKEEVVK